MFTLQVAYFSNGIQIDADTMQCCGSISLPQPTILFEFISLRLKVSGKRLWQANAAFAVPHFTAAT